MALRKEIRADISSAAHAMRSALLVILTGGEPVPLPVLQFESYLIELERNLHDETSDLVHRVIELAYQINAEDEPSARSIAAALDAVSALESHMNPLAIGEESLVEDVDLLIDESFDRMLFEANSPAEEDTGLDNAFPGFDIDDELREVFAEEAESLLSAMGEHLDRLAAGPENNDALWEIRRSAHTLKGSAGIVGLTAASEMAHRIEDLLDRLAETNAVPPPQIIPTLLTATECLRAMTSGDSSARVVEVRDHLFREFDKFLTGSASPVPDQPRRSKSKSSEAPTGNSESEESVPAHASEARTVVRMPIEVMNELLAIAREGSSVRSLLEQRLSALDRQVDELHNIARRLQSLSNRFDADLEISLLASERSGSAAGQIARVPGSGLPAHEFDALEFDRYTDIHESLRELAETAADASDISSAVEALNEDLEQIFRTQRRAIDGLQDHILRARRVHFDSLKPRMERIVRLTAADENKLVELHFENGSAEIDTQTLDSLVEPLQHLLKNAVVHGIESPEARRLLGKPETGAVTLRVDDRDTHIEISVSDDGAGIAANALAEKAVETGQISERAAAMLSEQERQDLIFKKGLTTAEKLDLNAGRGIGMSIVKDGVEALGGSLAVRSMLYGGTRFTIRMPLKLALANVLIVGVGRERVAIPMKNIDRIVEFSTHDIFSRDAEEFVEILGRTYLLRPLSRVLGWGEITFEANSIVAALIVTSATGAWAVAVENLVRSEELVIKPLGSPLDTIPDLIGAAELSTGEAAAIIDLRRHLQAGAVYQPLLEGRPVDVRRTVMVVDDSPSIRHMTGSVFSKAGMDVISAKDGVDALEKLEHAQQLPEIIFTDIEMPRLGGLELAARLKGSDAYRHIPVVVITSRSADKHREIAEEAGVTEYLTKPFAETDLIDAVNRHTASQQ